MGSNPTIATMEDITKENLKELKSIIDSWDLTFAKGPLTPAIDENGVVHLLRENGTTAILMNQSDYQDLVDYKESQAND